MNLQSLLRLIFFKVPEKKETFILKETPGENLIKDGDRSSEIHDGEEKPKDSAHSTDLSGIDMDLNKNLAVIQRRFNVSLSDDIVIRQFHITVGDIMIPAFLVAIDGMTDGKTINDDILQPLMLLSNLPIKGGKNDIAQYIRSRLLPHNQITEVHNMEEVVREVNFGSCSIFIDGIDSAFVADVKGFEHRGVERPQSEMVIRGPQEAFTETVRTNTALIRKRLKDADLIVETIHVGERSHTPCSMLYIKDIANDSLVKEVRRRMESIKVDYLQDSGELEQFIEDSTFIPIPQVLATERPDRAAISLTEGKVAVIVNGSPFALLMPTSLQELVHSSEDMYVRFPYSNLIRIVRIIGILSSLLLPGLYIAITNYHQELIPTGLLLAIEASRESVPFPSVIEILLMEMSFELIREAGIRIPGPIGPTVGIIGGLILGQAAVEANIVSPVLIIIVAFTGIGSFTYPEFSMAFAFRLMRFIYIFLGALAGFLGIITGLFIQGLWLVEAKSFGVPFLSPYGPKTSGDTNGIIYKGPIWEQESRPDYVNPKDKRKQSRISRGWTIDNNKEGDDDEP